MNYLHPVSVFRRDSHCRPNDQQKAPCSETVFAAARQHSVCGFDPIGEVLAPDLYRADAQPDITGSVLEQELESLHLTLALKIWKSV